MTSQPDRPILIRLASAHHPELLTGLEVWLELGLLSDEQVRQFCRDYLTSPLPSPSIAPAAAPVEQPSVVVTRRNRELDRTDFLPPDAAAPARSIPPASAPDPSRSTASRSPASAPIPSGSPASEPTTLIGRTLQAFMAEISVIWLLFLGVFLVVVSSGVLAASQWQNFSSIGQYGILFAYTLVFFGASVWAGRQPHLHLTARMLQITTLLIIPVNFWTMSAFGLARSVAGVGMAIVACLSLTAISWVLLRPASDLVRSNPSPRLTAINGIGLSWLHWGWSIAGIPLIATYIGTIGTALILFVQARQAHQPARPPQGTPSSPASPALPLFSPATIVITLSTLLLIGRAILQANVPLSQLGLAMGVSGWLLCWLIREEQAQEGQVREGQAREGQAQPGEELRSIWLWTGIALLLLGWSISVNSEPPVQAVIVSGLALWLLIDRLLQKAEFAILLTALIVGFETYHLLWRVLPGGVRQSILLLVQQVVGE
ncbi:MAG TPA: hypothetical protein V6C65_39510, partial [Allocoleopsis sp.]